jgi:uncharacterized protein (DUF2336 family)
MSDIPTKLAPRYARLAEFDATNDSGARRDILRQVTDSLTAPGGSDADLAQFDEALAAAAADYSRQVRVEIAKLVASAAGLKRVAESFAFDDIEVAAPILRRSSALSEETLLRVVQRQSQEHLLAVSKRPEVSQTLSRALVDHGDDRVVGSLLENEKADISPTTYDRIAERAENSTALQAPLVRRANVPPELLNGIYLKAESRLRREIMAKLEGIPAEEMEKAFQRSRSRVTSVYGARPEDFDQACKRVDQMERTGQLKSASLVALLREGKASRTAFILALARVADMEPHLVERVVEGHDIDTLALLCRGAGVDRAAFTTMAIALDSDPNRAMAGAAGFMKLYESVPVSAAQRALRFWKVRAAA